LLRLPLFVGYILPLSIDVDKSRPNWQFCR
jgi:hypothetical protein